jgi:3-methyladenine DNA glycosylase AlkD
MPDLVGDVRRALAAHADAARALRMQSYMKSSMPFLGLSAPERVATLRPILDARRIEDRDTWEAAVRQLWDGAEYREERYAAIALCRHRFYRAFQSPEALDLYRHLIETGRWWDLVDEIASHLVGDILRAHLDEVAPVMREWGRGPDLWLRRTAILCQIGSKSATDVALLDDVLTANLEGSEFGREFFIRKALGWALRSHAYTDPAWVQGFVALHRDDLSGLTVREALKHLDAP